MSDCNAYTNTTSEPNFHRQNNCTEALARTFLVWPFLPTRRRVEGCCYSWSHSVTQAHIRHDSAGSGIGPSQRPLPDKITFTRDRILALGGIRTHNPSTRAATGIGYYAYTTTKLVTVLYETCQWILLHSCLLRFTLLFRISRLYFTNAL
jgi:hypothetical protein